MWYINTPSSTPAESSGSSSYRGRISILVDAQKLQKWPPNYIWQGPDQQSLDSTRFATDPVKRTAMILKNADSIAMLTSYINEEFKGPQASLSVIKPHTSDISALNLASRPRQKQLRDRRLSL